MKMIGIVLAGGNNKKMRSLTAKRAIAAMPMCGCYRAIDFVLTNMTNSHVQKIAVLTQYNTKSLNEHLNSGKWWDLGRKQGGLFVYHPTITPENSNWYRGTADAMYQNLHFLQESHEPYVVVASGDGIYQLDYNKVLEYHIQKNADVTMVTTKLQDWEDATRFGQVIYDAEGRVTDLKEKPLDETTREVNCGIYIIRRRLLIKLLEDAMQDDRFDFVRDILVRQKDIRRIFAYPMDSYWSNISTAKSYYKTNMDFLTRSIRDKFFRGPHQVLTKVNDFPPAKYNPGASVRNSLISSGSIINGTVENSIIFKESYVGNNCIIRNSIILDDVYIGDNTIIEDSIVESHNTINANTRFKGEKDEPMLVTTQSKPEV